MVCLRAEKLLSRQVTENEGNRNNFAGGNNNRMKELTAKRAVPALPVAGSFRAIDFHSAACQTHIYRQLRY